MLMDRGDETHDILELKSILILPYEDLGSFNLHETEEIASNLMQLRKMLSEGFYFSYTYDLTLTSRQNRAEGASNQKFVWNHHLMRPFRQAEGVSKEWIFPIIQGYIGGFSVFVIGQRLDFFLISRRSWQKGGTRFVDRGIDDHGNVSNFCETEQIIFYNNFEFSYLQIRGSCPFFFQQTGYASKIEVLRSLELTT